MEKLQYHNIVVSINLTLSQSFVSYPAVSYFNWCRNFDTISVLLFNSLCSLYAAISYFLLKHDRQRFACVLSWTDVLTFSHLTFAWWPKSFIRQITLVYSFRWNDFFVTGKCGLARATINFFLIISIVRDFCSNRQEFFFQ